MILNYPPLEEWSVKATSTFRADWDNKTISSVKRDVDGWVVLEDDWWGYWSNDPLFFELCLKQLGQPPGD